MSFRLSCITIILVLSNVFILARSECCRPALLKFKSQNGLDCGISGAQYSPTSIHHCSIEVCGDGNRPKFAYCGIGSCNMFGCSCDDGCIQGTAKDSFLRRFNITLIE